MTIRVRNLGVNVIALVGLSLAYPALAHDVGDGRAKTAAQIFADAKQVTTRAKDFHVVSTIDLYGSTQVFNLNVAPKGGGGTLQFSLNAPNSKPSYYTLNIILAVGTLYAKANEKAWQYLDLTMPAAKLMANKWTRGNQALFDAYAPLAESTHWVGSLTSDMSGLTELPGATTFEGQHALVLTDNNHEKIYIASVGTPYILGARGGGAGSSASISFSGFGRTPLPKAPAHWISYPK
jgi:hypothetical protein